METEIKMKNEEIKNEIDPFCEEKNDLGIITEDMEKEEKAIAEENSVEEDELRNKFSKEGEIEKELSEQRHKRLMHLLTKSQFYSEYLLKKINEQKDVGSSGRKAKRLKQDINEENENYDPTNLKCGGRLSSVKGVKQSSRSKNKVLCDVVNEEKMRKESKLTEANVDGSKNVAVQPHLFENGEMRPYQLEGFTWLKTLFENGINGILADEMGLGKTVQVIAVICHLIYMGVPGPFLIVAPLSTLPNWILEFERFAPKVPTLLYHGSEAERKEKSKLIEKVHKIPELKKNCYPVVITSYEISIRDSKKLLNYFWRYLAVDEGHRLKNHKCLLFKALSKLAARNRIILTGTPLQNNLTELWALLNFLLPDIFDNLEVFESWFEIDDMMAEDSELKIVQQEREKQILSTLHKILNPFLLRRVKVDVDLQIPPKKELLVYVPLSDTQLKLYEAAITKNFSLITNAEDKEEEKEKSLINNESGCKRPRRNLKNQKDLKALLNDSKTDKGLFKYLMEAIKSSSTDAAVESTKKIATSEINLNTRNTMMLCRKIVNHPYLIKYPLTAEGEYKVDEELVKTCGKLQVLDQLLRELSAKGHKVLLFSQMTQLLDIIEDYLSLRPHYKYRRLDGTVSLELRRQYIDEYNNGDEYFLFLLSTRAGGLGINLTSADTVIIYDSDWNPQQDLQAQDRCHRIGQTKPVLVLRLVTASTIDQRMVERAANKRKLEKLVIKSGKFKSCDYQKRNTDEKLDPEELVSLLRSRDHDRIHKTSSGGGVFTKGELQQILDRNDMMNNGKENRELSGVFSTVLGQ